MKENILASLDRLSPIVLYCFSKWAKNPKLSNTISQSTILNMIRHYLYTVCCEQCSGKLLWLGLKYTNYEMFLCVESLFMLKTIPTSYSPTMIFSKNWKHISKIKWNPKIWAKIQIEFFCRKFFFWFFFGSKCVLKLQDSMCKKFEIFYFQNFSQTSFY